MLFCIALTYQQLEAMKQPLVKILLLLGLSGSRAAQAQFNSIFFQPTSRHCPCCCCPRDTSTTTERTNHVALLMGPMLLRDGQGRARAGAHIEVGTSVAPRLTLSGHLMMSINRASGSLGTAATAPAYGLHSLTGRARYQLLNSPHWRVEGLAGLGAGAVWLVDRDQQVYTRGRYGDNSHSATVAFRVHPLAEVGLSSSWKIGREFWLTSQASYAQAAFGNSLGTPGDFSYWSLSVAATMPWGHRVR